ncbi:MAG: hypothetical protein EAZ97_05930 [Bacteroidetes bacterium]|nr:MAG: hypothetical protein EAZ97_05930 [Bacteroidota bacterium]
MKKYVFTIFLIFWALLAFSQSNVRCKKIIFSEKAFKLDTLSLIIDSLQIIYPKNLAFYYNLNTNLLKLENKDQSQKPDSVLICYRVFPYLFSQKFQKRKEISASDSIDYSENKENLILPILDQRAELFSQQNIQKSGSISRGLSFGNQQDVFVNSVLNLQLNGKIAKDLRLNAVLSDQNVPFQPQGNTQQIQEFDKIFLQLSHPKGSISAGDVVFKNSENNYFLKYYKNVLGGMFETNYGIDTVNQKGTKIKANTKIGISAAKGQFFSQQVAVSEGIQGAYRLKGANGERFIVVLANSERVFLDGRLLARGYNLDYIIDYNTAEITFTNKIVITQFSRVRVDMEYSVQNYSRNILTISHEQQIGKWSFYGSFYREKDDPQSPIGNFTTADRQILQNLGDQFTVAQGRGDSQVKEFRNDQILYRKTDSLINGILYRNIFVQIKNQTELNAKDSIWNVVFSETTQKNGNYRLGKANANGKVYEWVALENGVSQGNFEPIRTLFAPNQKQMLAFGGAFQINEAEKIFVEIAFSNKDKNLFSDLFSEQNLGQALKIGYINSGKTLKKWKEYRYFSRLDYEYNSQFFSQIDRFRSIEFDRDWSANLEKPLTDQIANASFGIQRNPQNKVFYKITWRSRGEEVNGFQQNFDFSRQFGKFYSVLNYFLMNNQKLDSRSDWQRISWNNFYKNNIFSLGYQFSSDQNTVKNVQNQIISSAMYFSEHKFYLQNGDSSKTLFQADFAFRKDQIPENFGLQDHTNAQTLNISASQNAKNQDFKLLFTYRNVENIRLKKLEENLMGRLDWNLRLFKNALRSEMTLADASGRELKREFRFILVSTGQGTHIWRDDNGDGVQDLNEFYEAINPDERKYIKIFTPTDQYLSAFSSNFTYRLNANFPEHWKKKQGLKAFLHKFSSISSWAINQKITDNRFLQRFLPFWEIEDQNLLSKQENIRFTLFFNRTSPKFAIDLSWQNNFSKSLLTNGFEIRQQKDWQLNVRYNLSQIWNVKLTTINRQKASNSDFLQNRNYLITSLETTPEIAFQPNIYFRIWASYSFRYKENRLKLQDNEKANLQEFSLQSRFSKANERTVSAQIRYILIDYQGDSNSAVGYEMLEAQRNGKNWNWSLSWQQRLSNGLQFTATYEGRQAEGQAVVHIGRMQVMAWF